MESGIKMFLASIHIWCCIYDDADLREKVALSKAKAKDPEDAFSDPKKEKVYLKYMDSSQIKMYGELVNGKYVKGIEDFVPNEQYQTDEYVDAVIQDIKRKECYTVE